jgi:hypothetical protein
MESEKRMNKDLMWYTKTKKSTVKSDQEDALAPRVALLRFDTAHLEGLPRPAVM